VVGMRWSGCCPRAAAGPAYALLALGLWIALRGAAFHPTLAGVAVELLVPVYQGAPTARGGPPGADTGVSPVAELREDAPHPAFRERVDLRSTSACSRVGQLLHSWGHAGFPWANAGVNLDRETHIGDTRLG